MTRLFQLSAEAKYITCTSPIFNVCGGRLERTKEGERNMTKKNF